MRSDLSRGGGGGGVGPSALSIYVRARDEECLLLLELLFACFNLPVELGKLL